MRTAMIVDDEKPARELLKMMIDWNESGYQIIWEASDGIEALEQYKIRRPDLIITDILMPRLDGLGLIREIKKLNDSQKFLILSCYESFSYAKQAIKLGVLDYLIKDTISPSDLYTVLRNAAEMREERVDNQFIVSIGMIKKSEALWLLLNRELSEEQFCQSADEIEYNGNMSFFLISILIECTESEPNSIADKIQKTVFNILESENKGANCRISNRDFVALAYTKAAYSQISMLKQRYSIVQRIQSELEIISGCMVSLGVSDPCYDLKKIKTMFSEAQNSLGKRIFLGKGKILYYDNFRNLIGNTNVELLNTRMAKIQENLELKQQQQLLHEIDNIYNIDLRGIMQYNYLQHVNALLLGMLIFTCKQNGIPINKIFPNGSVPMDLLEELETADEIRGWFMERFSVLLDTSNNVGNLQSYHQTDKFITYMQQNYTKDISLESIATNFGIHKVYLAKIFKDKLGKSVNGYIRELRIEKAMELLRTSNYNISDIVHMVGFNNAQSFYIIFGRIAGVTPKEYRDGIDSRAKLRTLK